MNNSTVFDLIYTKKGQSLAIQEVESVIYFILSGNYSINGLGMIDALIKEKIMIFVPVDSDIKIFSYDEGEIVKMYCSLENYFSSDYIADLLSIMFDHRSSYVYMHDRIYTILSDISNYINDKVDMRDLSEILRQELFFVFKLYYTKEDIAQFFHPILSNDIVFKQLVISNCLDANNLDELALSLKYSKSGFVKKFHRCFGESPHKWISKYKAKRILQDIELSNLLFEEIAFKYGISSYSHFYSFCKKHYGASPGQIRARSRQKLD